LILINFEDPKIHAICYRFIQKYIKIGKKNNLYIYIEKNKKYTTKQSIVIIDYENPMYKRLLRISKDFNDLNVKDVLFPDECSYHFRQSNFEKPKSATKVVAIQIKKSIRFI
jgi:hypothetical protein